MTKFGKIINWALKIDYWSKSKFTHQSSLNDILLQLDKDGKGSISLYDYFGIFESHGIEVTQAESRRVIRLAGDDGMLTKENFFKIVQGSDFFLKSFDKVKCIFLGLNSLIFPNFLFQNNDGEVTEVK